MFALGAGLGRLIGELFKYLYLNDLAGIYAVVCAAAVATGTTQVYINYLYIDN